MQQPEEEDKKDLGAVENGSEVPMKRTVTQFTPREVLLVYKSELGEACTVCDVKSCQSVRVKFDSGAFDVVGPEDISKALKLKETATSKKGVGYVAANGSNVTNFGEKRVVGHTDAGDGLSMRIQRADVKKALGSVHEMSMVGNAAALDGEKKHARTRIRVRKRGPNTKEGST